MARKHIVVCEVCGRQFDANKEKGNYNPDNRRYTCRTCYRAMNKPAPKAKKSADPGKVSAAMIIKIVIGLIFFFTAFTLNGAAEAIVCLAIGIGLIAWALVPFIKAKKGGGNE